MSVGGEVTNRVTISSGAGVCRMGAAFKKSVPMTLATGLIWFVVACEYKVSYLYHCFLQSNHLVIFY